MGCIIASRGLLRPFLSSGFSRAYTCDRACLRASTAVLTGCYIRRKTTLLSLLIWYFGRLRRCIERITPILRDTGIFPFMPLAYDSGLFDDPVTIRRESHTAVKILTSLLHD
jgi:hypothetical protein